MALKIGFRGVTFDDAIPLYCLTTDGYAYNRNTGKWIDSQSLADAMTAASYIPTYSASIGVGGVEVGVPTANWQDTHNEHEFQGSAGGGRNWGTSGVVFPSGGGGGGDVDPDPIKGPFAMGDGRYFWINDDTCMIGFDLDGDGDADDWHTDTEVCESGLSDDSKIAISQALVACGCPPMMCMTQAGNLKVAYTLARIEAPEGSDDDTSEGGDE